MGASKMTQSAKNENRVPLKQWRRWSEKAREVFNRVYEFGTNNQWAMLHPKQTPPKPDHWKTTCWNAAWIAADAVDDSIPDEIVEVKAA